jgi:Tol biopolymer transport system component
MIRYTIFIGIFFLLSQFTIGCSQQLTEETVQEDRGVPESSPIITGPLERVSVDSDGHDLPYDEFCSWMTCNSLEPAISEDGQIVVFHTYLAPGGEGAPPVWHQIYKRDRSAETTMGLTDGSFNALNTTINSEGTKVAFHTPFSLLSNDTGHWDVYLLNINTMEYQLVSVNSDNEPANSDSLDSAISHAGLGVGFVSHATDLAPLDYNGFEDIFVYDFHFGNGIVWVNIPLPGERANGPSGAPSLNASGWIVAFESEASNLVLGDNNSSSDVFLRDVIHDSTYLISTGLDPITGQPTEANDESTSPALSASGDRVAFVSKATNLVPNDNNAVADVFVHDFSDDHMVRVSVASDGTEANGYSRNPSISADGRFVAFYSQATNLDESGQPGVFIHDLVAGETGLVSASLIGFQPAISADGKHVAFATQIDMGSDSNEQVDIYVRDVNWRPHADAGPDRTVSANFRRYATVTLDGSKSYDVDNDRLDFEWRSGRHTATGAIVTLQLPIGNYTATLIVTDEHGAQHVDTVNVQVVLWRRPH